MIAAHILLAEDDPTSAAVLRTVLERAGYRLTVTPDAPTTFQRLEESGPPDILLLDWMLPGITGLEICQRVRQRWDPVTLPILMVTARVDPDSIAAAFEAGASDYITKPFLASELRARIAAHLRLKRLVDEQRELEEHMREREKLSSLGLLVSGVAHDLNNPLAGIAGYAQLMLQEEGDPRKREDLRQILHEVERCCKIVGGLLSFARRNPPEHVSVDLSGVLRNTFEMRERHLKTSGVHASVQLGAALPAVVADAHQLQQVFLNILMNAEHALREGGRQLRISADLLQNGRNWVAVDFFNDGPAIPPEVLPHIFDPLFTTKPKEEGTGLGLAICQRVLQEHGGRIEVESGAEGTTFRVLLPVEQQGGQRG